jgi:peptidyl-prolyl cis-trans isomerase B (cyclophilin B)
MVQTGCPKGNGTGNAGHHVPAEFNDRKHVRGILSMARATHENSAGSQFFIMHATRASLDGKYTVFGKLVEAEDEKDRVLDRIANVRVGPAPNGEKTRPLERVELKGVTIEVR